MKPKILIILGQTATGKSDVAISLAKKYKGEVISADSRQVYKGLDIGTGKVTKKEMAGIPHYLLDIANPKKPARQGGQFSVAQFQKLALGKIKNIIERKKIPIIAGGTGFYIDSILYDTEYPTVPINQALRNKLQKKSVEELFKMLKKMDPRRAKEIDAKNPMRLIRAIELAKALGKVPAISKKPRKEYLILQIGLKLHPEVLRAKIKYRLLKRIDMGMIEEVKKLRKNGLSWKRMNELGLEYRYVALYLQKKITREEMIDELSRAIWRYAKRQDTWFKRDKSILWFDPSKKSDLAKLSKQVSIFLK
jgi:tRNA dimethylallyltransferase